MALDYNQKKQVNKNRPRKRPVKFMLLLILGSIFSIYGLGIATGWLVFKYLPKNTPAPLANSVAPEATGQLPPSPGPASPKGGTAAQGKDPDLTFYYTLPKGEKGVIGSGINSLPPETSPKPATSTAASAQKDKQVQQQKQSGEKSESAESAEQKDKPGKTPDAVHPTTALKAADKATYTVQLAAYHAKSDAQNLKARLLKSGISARIEEYSIPGKGLWYRVRTGSKLDKDTANKIAAKIGNNAMPIAE
jgi:cell division septation protein DedD